MLTISAKKFQKLLLNWFDQHGRKHLPWQKNKTPYRIFLSEVMLQQTQVATVIPYFQKFFARFPDVKSLADASVDEVLHLWAGLGYYSRARNLHRAARQVCDVFFGEFPSTINELQSLPGIGTSTAGAILAIAFNKKATILDGNVKRVLARLHGISEPINEKIGEKILWDLAEKYTPETRIADYTQAMMDLGATLCTRSKPNCAACPVKKYCVAYAENITHLLPMKKISKPIPTKSATFLIIKHQEKVLLLRRKDAGIWGGLYSFPEIADAPNSIKIQHFCQKTLKITPIASQMEIPTFRHTFSHYHLLIHPVVLEIKKLPLKIMDDDGTQIWYNPKAPTAVGLPKPIQLLMEKLS